MSGVFQNIDPPPPHPLASVYPPPLLRREDTHSPGEQEVGVNILEDARHSSVLYSTYVSTLWTTLSIDTTGNDLSNCHRICSWCLLALIPSSQLGSYLTFSTFISSLSVYHIPSISSALERAPSK
jgi:hypothetical protein